MNRRSFVLAGATAALASCLDGLPAVACADPATRENLVPETPCTAPNYWCTWAVQNYMYGHHLKSLGPEMLEGESGSRLAHDAMSEQALLGNNGWAVQFFPRVRKDLYLMLDDGWESGGTATFELDARKFPSFSGRATGAARGAERRYPQNRLARRRAMVSQHTGWPPRRAAREAERSSGRRLLEDRYRRPRLPSHRSAPQESHADCCWNMCTVKRP